MECGGWTPLCHFNGVHVNLCVMSDWPHAPTHRLDSAGAYIVTAATYRKEPLFNSAKRLNLLWEQLLGLLAQHGWKLEAWAVFPNHYHFVALARENAETLPRLIGNLHTITAREINRLDGTPGRKVWFQYWDTHLTYPRSYLARLNYVHCNAVHHGLVREAAKYPWCSAGWFERQAERPFYQTVMRIPSDKVNVRDDFKVDSADTE
jgi:putative transposase